VLPEAIADLEACGIGQITVSMPETTIICTYDWRDQKSRLYGESSDSSI